MAICVVEFEWDYAKEHANIKKLGHTFSEAVEAFQDPKGVQLVHSAGKESPNHRMRRRAKNEESAL